MAGAPASAASLPSPAAISTDLPSCVCRILGGEPVGHATKDISEKYAILSADLLGLIGPDGSGAATDERLVNAWIERNDAQNYVVLGDPAVRLRVDRMK
jgi:hypothetical protein